MSVLHDVLSPVVAAGAFVATVVLALSEAGEAALFTAVGGALVSLITAFFGWLNRRELREINRAAHTPRRIGTHAGGDDPVLCPPDPEEES